MTLRVLSVTQVPSDYDCSTAIAIDILKTLQEHAKTIENGKEAWTAALEATSQYKKGSRIWAQSIQMYYLGYLKLRAFNETP